MVDKDIFNKRIFPRYRLGSDIDLIIKGEKINARITDFSVGGIGCIIKGKSNLDSKPFDIKINDIDVDTVAKVVWTEDIFSGKRVGIQKIGDIKGNLSNYRLSDIFIGIQKMYKTGVLYIDNNSSARKVFFKQGDVIFSASDREEERMGDILVSVGKITPEQYKHAVDIMRDTGKRIGLVLVELGYLTPSDLIWAVRHQVEKIILNLFKFEDGKFIFKDDPLPVDEVITLKLSTGNLIYRGIKTISDTERIRDSFLSPDSVVYFSSDPLNLFQEIALDDNDRKILSLIDGKRKISDILSMSPLNETETLKAIFALYNTQLIEAIEKGTIDTSIIKEEIIEHTEPDPDPAIVEKIEKLYRDYKSLGYYGVLDIGRNASLDEIKRAYYRIARELHPDKHLHFQNNSLKEKLNTIFAYVNEAYRALTTPKNLHKPDSVSNEELKESGDNKKTAQMKFNEGRGYLNSNNYEQALVFLGQAIYFDNTVPEYHYYYGIALLKSKKIKDAEESVKKASQLDPYNPDYIAELGHIYLQLGFKTRAKNTFEKALKYDPFNQKASEGLKKVVSDNFQ
ncbi:MAG: DUF4388 domain-containing protein [Nitrospirota bacterium]